MVHRSRLFANWKASRKLFRAGSPTVGVSPDESLGNALVLSDRARSPIARQTGKRFEGTGMESLNWRYTIGLIVGSIHAITLISPAITLTQPAQYNLAWSLTVRFITESREQKG
jgi:hypothetical protein